MEEPNQWILFPFVFFNSNYYFLFSRSSPSPLPFLSVSRFIFGRWEATSEKINYSACLSGKRRMRNDDEDATNSGENGKEKRKKKVKTYQRQRYSSIHFQKRELKMNGKQNERKRNRCDTSKRKSFAKCVETDSRSDRMKRKEKKSNILW